MNSTPKQTKIPSIIIYDIRDDKTNTKDIKKKLDVHPDNVLNKTNNTKYGKNFVSKSSFKKMDKFDKKSMPNIIDNCNWPSENNNIFNYILYYYESTYEYLRKRPDYIVNTFNWKNSKNFKNINNSFSSSDLNPYNSDKNVNQFDKKKNRINSNKEIKVKNNRTNDDNNVSSNFLIINNININHNNYDIKNDNDHNYYINSINENEDQVKNEYFWLNNLSLLNQRKANIQFNNSINNYVNNSRQGFKNLSFLNVNNNIINYTASQSNIDNRIFNPSNFNQYINNNQSNIVNNYINLSQTQKSEIIKSNENILNLEKNIRSINHPEDNCLLEPEEYLIKMFGRIGWVCILCDNFNYETRYKCNKCGFPKRPKKFIEITKKDGKISYIKYNKTTDWFCKNCHNLNYSFRKVCNRCKATKPTENSEIVVPLSGIANNSSIIPNNINNSNLLNLSLGKFNI